MINAENELHENILTTLSHTYKIQRILGSARIKIINRSVFPNTIWEKLFTLFWLGAATVSIVYYEVYYYMRYYPLNFVLYVACAVGILSQYIIYVINVVYDKMLYRPGDAEIYFLIQKVNQKLMLHRCTYLTKSHVMLNYIFLTLVNVPFLIGYCIHVFYSVEKPLYVLFLGFQLLVIYMDIFIIGFFIIFLSMQLGFLNDLLIKYIAKTIPYSTKSGISRNQILKFLLKRAAIEHKTKCKNPPKFEQYFDVVRYILKCYKIVNEVYSLSVSTYHNIQNILTYSLVKCGCTFYF
ncbi:hypothetical protein O3G_MSEX006756 [Manduca sexta]|uniref:Uncharacterized protein n=1 Tax=Manduca sexta TaxID=7130 RepID=A0A922CLY4_MANSE|nr:hypothetical protein O3G_MSEX006756 [Manduca sexta]KAG6450768.1 hypothetical protein O3G_MSEX006756 [Manduca sexta]KAG6450769.1 hypothetical protein O3G_MSEX006756 [Manduca sexta]